MNTLSTQTNAPASLLCCNKAKGHDSPLAKEASLNFILLLNGWQDMRFLNHLDCTVMCRGDIFSKVCYSYTWFLIPLQPILTSN